jgi:hypothetical protein
MPKGKRIFLKEIEKTYLRKDHLEVEWPSLIYATNQHYPVSIVKVERAATGRYATEALRYVTSHGRTELRDYKSLASEAGEFQSGDVDSAGMDSITKAG